MFHGHHPTRIDEKGRFKVPAEYKRKLDESYGAQFYITSRDGKIAEVYPLEVWERLEREIMAQRPATPSFRKFLNVTSYYGQVAEIDGQGRLLLPSLLREKAGLKGDVAVVGKLERLEIRIAEDYRREVEENQITPEDNEELATHGIW